MTNTTTKKFTMDKTEFLPSILQWAIDEMEFRGLVPNSLNGGEGEFARPTNHWSAIWNDWISTRTVRDQDASQYAAVLAVMTAYGPGSKLAKSLYSYENCELNSSYFYWSNWNEVREFIANNYIGD